jgi:hypothetical protein
VHCHTFPPGRRLKRSDLDSVVSLGSDAEGIMNGLVQFADSHRLFWFSRTVTRNSPPLSANVRQILLNFEVELNESACTFPLLKFASFILPFWL